MPPTPPLSRRNFCRTTLGGTLATMFLGIFEEAWAEEPQRDHWVFLSDTHMLDSPDSERGGRYHVKNFVDAREAILNLSHKPKGVIITGDVAQDGTLAEYRQLAVQIAPLTEKGIPVHVAFGNHDRRDNFHTVFSDIKREASPVPNKHVTVLETPHANLFLLDSLYDFPTGSGFLGYEQLRWLQKELEARKEKPALLFAHHTLDNRQRELMDREELWTIIGPANHVKAYIYGHSHIYRQSVRDNVHLINLPAVCWGIGVRDVGMPAGWSDVEIASNGIQLTLHTLPSNHLWNGNVRKFEWLR